MIPDRNRSKAKESDNRPILDNPKFWYKTKSFEFLESENFRINKLIKNSFKVIITKKGVLKNINKTAIKVDASRMVL